MSYKVKLQYFEGPFDLLVFLIESAEMSIYDIKIAEITTQYMDFIREMQEADIDVAEEFIVLAATLIDIKSKMILPRTTVEGEIVIDEDPRTELVERILEYKKFKSASDMLKDREERMQHVYSKPQEDISQYLDNPDEYLSLDIKQFAAAFSLFIQKKQKIEMVKKHYTRIERERANVGVRMKLIMKTIRERLGERVNFKELIPDKKDKYDIIVTFTSLLDMAKERIVSVEQKMNYGDIEVGAGENINEEEILEKLQKEAGKEEKIK